MDGQMQSPGGGSDDELLQKIIAALRTVSDPEMPTNIYDLGLIYAIDVIDDGEIAIKMTLTAPTCPVAGILPRQVEAAITAIGGITQCRADLVWDPPWSREKMSEEARLELGLF